MRQWLTHTFYDPNSEDNIVSPGYQVELDYPSRGQGDVFKIERALKWMESAEHIPLDQTNGSSA